MFIFPPFVGYFPTALLRPYARLPAPRPAPNIRALCKTLPLSRSICDCVRNSCQSLELGTYVRRQDEPGFLRARNHRRFVARGASTDLTCISSTGQPNQLVKWPWTKTIRRRSHGRHLYRWFFSTDGGRCRDSYRSG